MAKLKPLEVLIEFDNSAMRWMRRMEFVIGGTLGVSLAALALSIYAVFWS